MNSGRKQGSSAQGFLLGDWSVDPAVGKLRRRGKTARVEPKVMEVLTVLADKAGHVVARDDILKAVWPETFVAEVALTRCISELRRVLEDDVRAPRYIETVPKKGYRLIAPVTRGSPPARRRLPTVAWGILAVGLLAGMGWYLLRESLVSRAPEKITSLAVLPLENLMEDTRQDYFVQGMHEALITELSRIGALRVISRTSTVRYKGTDRPLEEIAEELNVDALIEGSVLRSGDELRITAQLIGLDPERHLWVNSYERQLRDVLALQSEIARNIAQEIQVTLTPEEKERLTGARPVEPDAYQAYLKGRHHWGRRTAADFQRSVEYFQEAIEKDPDYALAYVGLADAHILRGGSGLSSSTEAFEEARTLLLKALEIDRSSAEAHTSLALVKGGFDWDWAGAERGFEHAILLSPNYSTAHHWRSMFLKVLARDEEAIAEIRLAQKMDPLSSVINTSVAETLVAMGQYDQALEEIESTLELDPNFALSHEILGWIYLAKEMPEKAILAFRAEAEISAESPEPQAELAYAYAAAGQKDRAIKIVEGLELRSKESYVSPYFIALAYTGLGERDRAFEWLEKAFNERSTLLPYITGPLWHSLRGDPRYGQLLRRMNLPEEAIARHQTP